MERQLDFGLGAGAVHVVSPGSHWPDCGKAANHLNSHCFMLTGNMNTMFCVILVSLF